jgi:hypothetical protein
MRGVLLLGLVVLTTGCSPCVERCRVLSRKLDRCLTEWDLEWADFDAEDRPTWRKLCVADQRRWVEQLQASDEGAANEQAVCRELNDDLWFETDCEAIWESLNAFGADS